MTSPRDPARLRQGLHPLTTTLAPFNSQHTVPLSAISMSSSHLQSAYTPASAIQPYNPQEWVASPAPGSERQHQYAGQSQNTPPPPPPYSPPRSQQSQQPVTVYDNASISTPPPVPRVPSANFHRPSPEPQANPSFPPPPGSGGRGASRERRFLASLGRRARDREQEASTPEFHSPPHATRQSLGAVPFHTPEPVRPSPITPSLATAPPAARRAMSAGAVETPTSARSRSGSQHRWDSAGLPPPPPGPPPPQSRSQSVQPMDRANVPIISPPTRRPPPNGGTALGPVPPTPADWVDDSKQRNQAARNDSPALTIDTTTANVPDAHGESAPSSSSAGGLNRAGAVRHDKTIIQRRTESRTRHSARSSIDERTHSMPDIVVPGGSSSGFAKSKTTPRSGGMPQTGESSSMGDSRHSTPRVGSARAPHPIDTATPPFSPFPPRPGAHVADSPSIPPKSLPTPPPHTRSASSSKARESSRPPPLSATSSTSKYLVVTQSAEQFATGGVERFQAFAAKEAAASSDADRVRMFADFIVNESRIRRERYSTAIGAMGSEIFDLTRDLFRPMVAARRESTTSHGEWTPESSEPNRSHRGSISSVRPDGPSSAPGSARLPPSPSGSAAQNNANYASNYMPSLSPILSMSVSDNHDGSSRGRPSSRWWETESAQGDPSRKFERSKRESKYMGVPKEQWIEVDSNANPESESSSEYPPEKTGWHDQSDEAACTPKPSRFSQVLTGSSPSPVPQNADYLDVSRLVTMPPPYPRHHPAVNNNHPELASIRTSVRALTDLTEVDQAKEDFTLKSSKRRDDFSKEANERKQALRANLQQEINSGNLGYADAAAIESDSQDQERAKQKELEKNEYEHFQNEVIMPLNELLTSRIAKATELHDDLAKRLFDSSQLDADMPQEEGDDRPELLEKLTLLKWIFEARESLHKAIYDLLTERNTRYSDVVMTPYRLSGNAEKLKSAEEFFAGDAAKREHAYAYEVLDRSRAFRGVMDEAVQRGVALQLSAFWDIAPPLCRLLEKVPSELEGFNIQIPLGEFEENPAYYDHPMQYLFSLLLHTEKSTHQFIEAHTNLLCLLHEVKEAVVHAKAKVLATQTVEADGTAIRAEVREERATELRQHEARRLTEDLKEQVRVVQDQWSSALGDCIRSVKERSRGWLLETGGWDETLETDS